MRTLRQLAVGAALITALAGAGSVAAPGTGGGGPAGGGLQQTALETMQGKKPCGMGNASVMTAMIQSKPGSTCGCGKNCPFPTPPADCGPDEKVNKQKVDCNFTIACDGEVIYCSLKATIETCVPKNGPMIDA